MKFSNPSEAILAMVSLALSADQVGTSPEQKYLFTYIRNLKPFKALDRATYTGMLSNVNNELFGSAAGYAHVMQADGILKFCKAVKAVLPEDSVESTYQMACEIACSDELVPVEKRMLQALGIGLGMQPDRIASILLAAERECSVDKLMS